MDELGAYLLQEGLTASSFYFGHNYRGGDLARFFNLAAQDGMTLTWGERELLDSLLKTEILHKADLRYIVSDEPVAVLGVSQPQEDDASTPELELIDSELRQTILRHELSHGVFFTDPDYRRYVMMLWNQVLTEQERSAFRGYFEGQHYNPDDEVMMANEMQAYLFHTLDPRAFHAPDAGMSPERAAELRRQFQANAPQSRLLQTRPVLE